MTSEPGAFVWVWLPGSTEPVVAGAVTQVGDELRFNYGRSYLQRADSIPLQPDGLPLVPGAHRPPVGLEAHGVIRDAAPDSWGMQIITRRLLGAGAADTNEVPLLTHLVESGSNRIGALDFQSSPTEFRSRDTHGTLEELVDAGERMAMGLPFSPELDDALTHGTSVGGARPKALLVDDAGPRRRELIAKFSVSTDTFPWVQAESVGMELARRCGVEVAPTELTRAQGRDVLLVERFDRPADGTRRLLLSGLTLLGLHEMVSRYGTYVQVAEQLRLRSADPEATLRELFTRIVVSVLIGNTDDHPRNISVFWDGRSLELTPAYDMCPQPRSTGEAEQAMAFGSAGLRRSRLADVATAAATYRLSAVTAAEIIDRCTTTVMDSFDEVCAALGVDPFTRDLLWRRSVANESIFYPVT